MLSARASWLAGCLALAAIAALPAGGGVVRGADEPRALPKGCDERVWHWHLGRVALYSMYPKGRLTPRGGASPSFDYRGGLLYPAPERNTYTDAAGVAWVLNPDWQAAFHQPEWWDGEGDAPNKKFVALDGRGGSYEAVLQPDGTATWSARGPRGQYSYDALNWLRAARGMKWIGTYNYADATEPVSQPGLLHWIVDVRPHDKDANYAPIPDGLSELDPDVVSWRTYVARAMLVAGLFTRPLEVTGVKLPRARLVANGSRVAVVYREPAGRGRISDDREHPVDADLVPLARYLARCIGEDEVEDCEKLAVELVLLSEAGRRHTRFLKPENIAVNPVCHDLTGDGRDDVAFEISGGGSGGSFEWTVFVARPDAAEDAPASARFRELEVDHYDARTQLSREGDRLVTRNPIYLRGDANCCARGGTRERTYEVTDRRVVLVGEKRLRPE